MGGQYSRHWGTCTSVWQPSRPRGRAQGRSPLSLRGPTHTPQRWPFSAAQRTRFTARGLLWQRVETKNGGGREKQRQEAALKTSHAAGPGSAGENNALGLVKNANLWLAERQTAVRPSGLQFICMGDRSKMTGVFRSFLELQLQTSFATSRTSEREVTTPRGTGAIRGAPRVKPNHGQVVLKPSAEPIPTFVHGGEARDTAALSRQSRLWCPPAPDAKPLRGHARSSPRSRHVTAQSHGPAQTAASKRETVPDTPVFVPGSDRASVPVSRGYVLTMTWYNSAPPGSLTVRPAPLAEQKPRGQRRSLLAANALSPAGERLRQGASREQRASIAVPSQDRLCFPGFSSFACFRAFQDVFCEGETSRNLLPKAAEEFQARSQGRYSRSRTCAAAPFKRAGRRPRVLRVSRHAGVRGFEGSEKKIRTLASPSASASPTMLESETQRGYVSETQLRRC
ncbi:hypothetical protein SKAU_G00139580 [Synaphobranchus kaupii]|uniref:Uncharacterized protein n=1 Tax=Synaphobranchus kaupii TaxID=118154 RepID=A0A9Q1FT03_SYNKA|nr:hypothetical protein SKAU_G00139580 [Synaphobranchus kaupii]